MQQVNSLFFYLYTMYIGDTDYTSTSLLLLIFAFFWFLGEWADPAHSPRDQKNVNHTFICFYAAIICYDIYYLLIINFLLILLLHYSYIFLTVAMDTQ